MKCHKRRNKRALIQLKFGIRGYLEKNTTIVILVQGGGSKMAAMQNRP